MAGCVTGVPSTGNLGGFALILVLFILLVIIGLTWLY